MNRGTVNPNQRGVKLLGFANYFNLCPTNLLSRCEGPLMTYFSHCERYKLTIDYIFLPNCLYHSIVSRITFDRDIENTSDHVPVKLQVEFFTDRHINMINDTNSYSGPKLKVNWSKFSQEEIERNYTTPISADLENMTIVEHCNLTNFMENLTKILLQHSHHLVKSIRKTKNNKRVYGSMLSSLMILRLLVCKVRLLSTHGNNWNFHMRVLLMVPTVLNEKSTDRNYAIFWNNVKLIRLGNYITSQILMTNYFGNF